MVDGAVGQRGRPFDILQCRGEVDGPLRGHYRLHVAHRHADGGDGAGGAAAAAHGEGVDRIRVGHHVDTLRAAVDGVGAYRQRRGEGAAEGRGVGDGHRLRAAHGNDRLGGAYAQRRVAAGYRADGQRLVAAVAQRERAGVAAADGHVAEVYRRRPERQLGGEHGDRGSDGARGRRPAPVGGGEHYLRLEGVVAADGAEAQAE